MHRLWWVVCREHSCQIQSKRNPYEAVASADKLCICFLMRSHCSMSWLEFSLPRLLPSILSHFPQLSWIRRLIYPDTCTRGFISCSVSVLINVRGLLTCLTPDGTLCLLWQNGKVESVTCFDTGVTGLLGARLCVLLCNYSCFAYVHAIQRQEQEQQCTSSAISHAQLLEK